MSSKCLDADSADTVIAPITSSFSGAVSLVRLSGSLVPEICKKVVERHQVILANPRKQIYSAVYDLLSAEHRLLDYTLTTYFKAPQSFTGEDCLEVSLHGSPFLQTRFIESCLSIGVRLARAGEFSERAYMNGRIDLTQAEAVADLVNAETELQARCAREQFEGKLAGVVSDLGEPLRNLAAEVEAYIDFPEEEIELQTREGWNVQVGKVVGSIKKLLATYRTGRLYREGAQVVLVGAPNAGKSSLMNRILGEDRAIVSSRAGTTRDSIGERVNLNGLLVRLWDTAGLVEDLKQIDEIEEEGIRRSWKLSKSADLIVYLFDVTESNVPDKAVIKRIAKEAEGEILYIANKCDLLEDSDFRGPGVDCCISAQTGTGLDELIRLLSKRLLNTQQFSDASVMINNERHKEALETAVKELKNVQRLITSGREAEIVALNLRFSLNALSELIGVTHTEDILGRIFSKFCIGK